MYPLLSVSLNNKLWFYMWISQFEVVSAAVCSTTANMENENQ